MTLSEFRDYFEQIATAHEDIRHGENGKVRFIMFDPDEVGAESRFKLDTSHFGLYLKQFSVKMVRDNGGQFRKVYNAGYAILKTANRNDKASEDMVQSEAELIAQDIFLELMNRQRCGGGGWLTIGSSTRLKIDETQEVYDAEPIAGLTGNLAGFDVVLSFYEHTDHTRRRPGKFS